MSLVWDSWTGLHYTDTLLVLLYLSASSVFLWLSVLNFMPFLSSFFITWIVPGEWLYCKYLNVKLVWLLHVETEVNRGGVNIYFYNPLRALAISLRFMEGFRWYLYSGMLHRMHCTHSIGCLWWERVEFLWLGLCQISPFYLGNQYGTPSVFGMRGVFEKQRIMVSNPWTMWIFCWLMWVSWHVQ